MEVKEDCRNHPGRPRQFAPHIYLGTSLAFSAFANRKTGQRVRV